MPIIKVRKKENPYVILDKTFLNDSKISLKSKGLLSYLLGLPSSWNIHVKELVTHFPDGKYAIYSAIKELKERGYVIHKRCRDQSGSYQGGEYHVFETPQSTHPNFPDVDKSDKGNQTLLNNKNNKIKTAATTAAREAIEQPLLTVQSAVVSFNQNVQKDALIADRLTDYQNHCIHRAATELAQRIVNKDSKCLEKEMIQTLLDPKAFSHAGQNFFKKLNTILKIIRDGRWTTPVSLQKEQEDQFNQESIDLQCQLRELQGDEKQLRWMQETLGKKASSHIRDSFHRQIRDCQAKITEIVQAITTLQKKHGGASLQAAASNVHQPLDRK